MRSAVLEAALEELVAGGYAAFSFEAVAKRAGVHKTTLYRRWGRREELLLDAMLELGSQRVPIPDTGSLRRDLLELGKAIVASARTPEVEAVVRAVAATGDRDPKLAEASRRFWDARLELAGQIVERAIARGEIPAQSDPGLVLESLIAPIYFRLLITGEKLDRGFLERLADLVAAGASGRSVTKSGSRPPGAPRTRPDAPPSPRAP